MNPLRKLLSHLWWGDVKKLSSPSLSNWTSLQAQSYRIQGTRRLASRRINTENRTLLRGHRRQRYSRDNLEHAQNGENLDMASNHKMRRIRRQWWKLTKRRDQEATSRTLETENVSRVSAEGRTPRESGKHCENARKGPNQPNSAVREAHHCGKARSIRREGRGFRKEESMRRLLWE